MKVGKRKPLHQKKQPFTKKCSFCAKEILADTMRYKYCGEWLNKQASQENTTYSITGKKRNRINIILQTTITCHNCGLQKEETMLLDANHYFTNVKT
jgi:hypothetical protein